MSSFEVSNGRVLAADLLAVVATVALAAGVVFTPLGDRRALAVGVGLPFVLLVPGYALVSAVFPRAGELAPGSGRDTSWSARLGVSVAGSGIAVTVVGGVLDFTAWGFDRAAVVVGLSAFTVAATALAWYRRRGLPTTDQAGFSVGAVRSAARSAVDTRSAVSVLLTVAVLIAAAGAVGVVAEESTGGADVVELYVLGEDESGDLTAGEYPSNATVGEPFNAAVGVGASGAAFDGYVVTRLERVTVDGDAVTVESSRRLGRIDVQVAAGERTVRRHTVRPSMAGERLRMTYRLYRSGSTTPMRQVHVWVTVRSA